MMEIQHLILACLSVAVCVLAFYLSRAWDKIDWHETKIDWHETKLEAWFKYNELQARIIEIAGFKELKSHELRAAVSEVAKTMQPIEFEKFVEPH